MGVGLVVAAVVLMGVEKHLLVLDVIARVACPMGPGWDGRKYRQIHEIENGSGKESA